VGIELRRLKMRDYLVFQLYGPLASWGDIAVGETRPSSLTPAKSAVLGLLAAALGIKHPATVSDEAERAALEARHAGLARDYGFSFKVEALGTPLCDYHTAQVPSSGKGKNRIVFPTRRDELTRLSRHDLHTILSRRDYRQDAWAAAALWARPDAPHTLETLRDALASPRFVLYLGRKSCPPALPLAPRLVATAWMEDALAEMSLAQTFQGIWKDQEEARRMVGRFQTGGALVAWDTDAETRLCPAETITRRDAPSSRLRWQFAVRTEHRAHFSGGQT
jgi:CRISPR system Cascade subunit CasD